MTPGDDITRLLHALDADEPGAADELFRVVYADLHAAAQRQMRALPPGATLQATALINEAYIRLVGEGTRWENRRHFYFVASRAMHRIVVQYARRHTAAKRGGGARRLSLDAAQPQARDTDNDALENLLEVDRLFERLQAHDERCAEIVRMQFFAGLTHEQVAEALDIPYSKVRREWDYAKAWLRREASRDSHEHPDSRADEDPVGG